jgi:hypothetical protein
MEIESGKVILLATFIPKNNVEWFLKYLKEKFNIKKENVFIYQIVENELEYLFTFKLQSTKKINLKFYFQNYTIVNNKCGCIFSINGLNRLIEHNSGCDIGNINYNNHKISWGEYTNKLILSNNNKLTIKNIKKIN